MCGIAGFDLGAGTRVDRTLLAQALLTGIAERGSHASGLAFPRPDGTIAIEKRRTGASDLLPELRVPPQTLQALIHVREYTKGHPTLAANNHPIRHGSVVGIHNGQLENDEQLFELFALDRAEPGMTVDSEAIFALVHHLDAATWALEHVRGTMACAWFDERKPGILRLARGRVRPLVVAETRDAFLFASTEYALRLAARVCGLGRITVHEVAEGELLAARNGCVVHRASFAPPALSRPAVQPEDPSPSERERCLALLERIAAAA
jgi:glutamine phosphoribosylpyrophosphate amidotransferase